VNRTYNKKEQERKDKNREDEVVRRKREAKYLKVERSSDRKIRTYKLMQRRRKELQCATTKRISTTLIH
jgi:hypothetical protein